MASPAPVPVSSRVVAEPAAAPVPESPAAAVQAAPAPVPVQAPAQSSAPAPAPAYTPAPAPRTAAPASAPAAAPQARPQAAAPTAPVQDTARLQRMWKQVQDSLRKKDPARASLLASSHAVADDGESLTIEFPKGSSFSLHMLARETSTPSSVLPSLRSSALAIRTMWRRRDRSRRHVPQRHVLLSHPCSRRRWRQRPLRPPLQSRHQHHSRRQRLHWLRQRQRLLPYLSLSRQLHLSPCRGRAVSR